MKIIAGCARNAELLSPPDLGVRPTAVRSRKALFDSIGAKMNGAAVLDLFSGSGALGLEAASRGAAEILMIELDPRHIPVIEQNIQIVQKTGAAAAITLINADVLDLSRYSKRISHADYIFADPPYARSGELFQNLLTKPRFREDFAGAQLFWEIPDTPGAAGAFINSPALKNWQLREFAGTRFLIGTIAEPPLK
ncbi:MAG: RsmD family RNA methyltransferase [Lentisphaeria bacterium]|nr:RsmD family RNA methyltransferase [Lentisphaeria bacterium]